MTFDEWISQAKLIKVFHSQDIGISHMVSSRLRVTLSWLLSFSLPVMYSIATRTSGLLFLLSIISQLVLEGIISLLAKKLG